MALSNVYGVFQRTKIYNNLKIYKSNEMNVQASLLKFHPLDPHRVRHHNK